MHYFWLAVEYADDLVLLVSTPSAMRKLLAVCDNCAQEFIIEFIAKKSKLLAIVSKKRRWLSCLLDHCRFQTCGWYSC